MNFPSTTPGVPRRAVRRLAAISALALTVFGLGASAANAASGQLLLVHGHGDATKGKDCNGDIWENALRYCQDAGGRGRSSLTTIGYYPGDKGRCDAMIGDGKASNARPIQDIARDLAIYIDREYTSQGRPVDVIAHSMGGLITRVALLGSAQSWDGFPARKLNVDNVVTLSTPHQGVANPGASNDRQWRQMGPDSGFIARLQENGSGLGDSWAKGTDWSLVGSHEDTTVSHDSGIDKGNAADQKLGCQDDSGDSGEVSHTGVRELEMQRMFGDVGQLFTRLRHHHEQFNVIVEGDTVVVEGTSHGVTADGTPWRDGRWCDVFEIRDFKIQRCFIYLDPDYAGADTERYPWLREGMG